MTLSSSGHKSGHQPDPSFSHKGKHHHRDKKEEEEKEEKKDDEEKTKKSSEKKENLDKVVYPVELFVYDLSDGLAAALSEQLLGKKIEGIWHTSIHVHGKEYWFGHGMQVGIPRKTQFGQPKEVLQMGETEVDEEGFQEYLEKLQPRYNVGTYNLTNHNCNNFSDEVCMYLVDKNIPKDIVSLPSEVLDTEFGQAIKPMLEVFENRMKNTKGHNVFEKDATMLDKERCKRDKDTKQFPEEDRDYCEERVKHQHAKQLREQMHAELKPVFALAFQALAKGLANNRTSAAPGLPHHHHHTSM